MTSPYITFEEMEEGVEYASRLKGTGALSVSLFKKVDGKPCVQSSGPGRFWIPTQPDDGLLLYPIPAYSPPNSWDEHLDAVGDFRIIKNNEGDYFSNRARILANDKELRAAIDWLQDELDRREKAGES